jgi:cytochrome c553
VAEAIARDDRKAEGSGIMSGGGCRCLVAALAVALPMAAPAVAAGDRALGEYLSSECVTCHQLSGRPQTGIPSIIGVSEARIAEMLTEYKAKRRDNAVMQTIAGKFSGDEIAALAAYFGSLKARN